MTISSSDILAQARGWDARAWIDGQAVPLVGGPPTRILSALRGRAQASLQLRDLPPSGGGLPVIVDLVLDNFKTIRFFTGKTDPMTAASAAVTRQINLIDLVDLNKAVPSPITWSSTAYTDAVRDLLNAAGVEDSQIDSIYDPGSTYTLGSIYDIVIATRENIGSVLGELLSFGGCAFFTTPTGRVRVVNNTGVPADNSPIVYAAGADRALGEFALYDSGLSIEGNEAVVSVFAATGPQRPDGEQPDGAFTATGIVGRSEGQNYRFAQTDAQCLAIARREVGRRARARTNITFDAPLNPLLLPGDTVLFRDATIGFTTNTPVYVLEVATTADGAMRVIASIGASLVDGFESSTRPPVADFSMQVETQPIVISASLVQRYFVQCLDQSRDLAGYNIVARSWSASGTGATPTTASTENPKFFFTDLTGASITLTVTSETGEEATVTRPVETPDVTIFNRVVSVAAGSNGWRVLGATAWRAFTGGGADCTAVPPYNASGPLYAGFANGRIYRSSDELATAPTLIATLTAPIRALYVNENDPDELLAGHAASYSRSRNGGATWELLGTFSDAIVGDLLSGSNPDAIAIAAGRGLSTTIVIGGSFSVGLSPLITNALGTVATAVTLAPWGHYAATWSGGASEADAIRIARRPGGDALATIDWSGVPAELRPAALGSVTHLLGEEAFVAGEAKRLVRDGLLSGLVFSAASSADGRLYKFTRTDSLTYAASILTPTTPAAAGKLINQDATYPLDSLSATSVGYGGFAVPPAANGPELLLLTRGGSLGGAWHYRLGLWTLRSSGLPAGWTWLQVATNPANADDWAIAGYNGSAYTRDGTHIKSGGEHLVWRTTNAGASWAAIPVADPASITQTFNGIFGAAETRPVLTYAGGTPVLAGTFGTASSVSVVLWRLSAGALAATTLLAVGDNALYGVAGGDSGEVIITYAAQDGITGTASATLENGVEISGLTIGQAYTIEATGGPYNYGGGNTAYAFQLSNNGGSSWSSVIRTSADPAPFINGGIGPLHVPSWATSTVAADSLRARVTFTATTTSIRFRCADNAGAYFNNSGSLGWRLRLAGAGSGENLGYVASGASTITMVSATAQGARVARLSTASRAVVAGAGAIAGLADYRSGTLPAGLAVPGGGAALAGARGHAFVAGGRSGIYRIVTPTGTPAGAVVAAAAQTVYGIGSDPQARERAAAIAAASVSAGVAASVTVHHSADGETWTAIDGPAGGGLHAHALAVIRRA